MLFDLEKFMIKWATAECDKNDIRWKHIQK